MAEMARPLRIEREGAWYHITARGVDRPKIFLNDIDRRHWLGLLAEAVERYRLIVHVFVLMENHFHILGQTAEANLSACMHWLNTSYSIWFNRRHRRVGPLWQGGIRRIWWMRRDGVYGSAATCI